MVRISEVGDYWMEDDCPMVVVAGTWLKDFGFTEGKKVVKEEEDKKINKPSSSSNPMVRNKMQVEDIVNLTVRKARDVLKNVNDLKLLKYSLAEARQLSNKDSLCREIDKRIKQLHISR